MRSARTCIHSSEHLLSTHRDNFDSWYKNVLELLYPHRDAGFAILLIAFPLLERFLRLKTGTDSAQNLTDSFFDELGRLFPELKARTTAKNFWQIYRNGLLHELTLSRQTRGGVRMPTGSLSHDRSVISIEPNGNMWIHPVEFAQRVVTTIESDFKTFEGASTSPSRLPTEKTYPAAAATGSANAQVTILGTNTDP